MGVFDAFSKEDRVPITACNLISYFRSEARTYAENEVMINGLRAGLPASHILVMVGRLDTDIVSEEDESC